jgi:EpsI family protein
MIARRDFLIGAACCLGSGAAYALKPRRQTTLMDGGKKLNEILPTSIEGWTSRDVSDLVAPETPDSLAARLYGETVGRIYHQQSTGDQVIMLMAHGDVENNELQLHRPEVCYPAFGFAIVENTPVSLTFPKGVTVPCRRLIATSSEREETILYWTRLGEAFPTTVGEQRIERLRTAMHRYIPDGLLARFSVVGSDKARSLAIMEKFVPNLVMHVAANQRKALIGTVRASALSATS